MQQILKVLGPREQLLVRLAIFSGMRPGEIIGLQWKHVHDDHVDIEQRMYRGKLDRPKTTRSKRQAAVSTDTQVVLNAVNVNGGLPVLLLLECFRGRLPSTAHLPCSG